MAKNRKRNFGNIILDSMPDNGHLPFLDQMECTEVGIREVLQKPDMPIDAVYFPVNSVFSAVATADHSSVEVATIGHEGMVGVSVFLGHPETTITIFSQIAGDCWRCPVEPFQDLLDSSDWINRVMHRYTQCLMVQISQSVVCNAQHQIQQRCARWLLMTADRVASNDFLLTQSFLAQMLGVRRASVTGATGELQRQGLLRYSRGKISITDREGLEAASCECYAKVTREYTRFAKDIRNSSGAVLAEPSWMKVLR